MTLSTIMQYLDLFGNKITFYNEKMPKLYTVTGGVFSIVSILVCIIIFISFSLQDLKRKIPITTMSSIPSVGYKNIKFGKEKIWIPWRVIDYNNKFINHSGILYPIIYYYTGIKDTITKDFNLTSKMINYKLCSETSMAIKSNIYQISVPLDEIFCIDMDDLDVGGSWLSEFINYVEFDLYLCQDGIDYDENNTKCATYQKISNYIGEDNSLDFALYYPVVQFQPTNKTNPVIVIYRQYFYHFSKFSNKIERLFLQENVLTDDSGWILTKESNSSYWGLNNLQADNYFTGSEKDLMNEGSSSRVYSFNIYLEPGIIHYKRYYKKFHNVLSDFFPLAYIIFLIMKNITKLFKKAEINKKMVELLFEKLKEKPNIFEENLQKLRISNRNSYNIKPKPLRFSLNSLINYKNDNIGKKRHNFSIDDLSGVKEKLKVHHSSFALNKDLSNNNDNSNNSGNKNNTPQKKANSKFFKQYKRSLINTTNQHLISKEKFKREMNFIRLKEDYKNYSNRNLNIYNQPIQYKREFIKEKMFPYKYYLCSAFIRNLDISHKHYFVSSRFAKIYIFLCQLIDITTYLSLQREFNALKSIFNDKSLNIIEKNKKININSNTFIKEISDAIGEQKFHILAQGNR